MHRTLTSGTVTDETAGKSLCWAARRKLCRDWAHEDLGPEVTAKAASAYYGSFIKPMRLRLRLSLLLLVFMAWLSLGLPVTGLLKNYRVAGLFCLGLQLCIMLLCLDVVTNGVMSAFRRRPGAETLAVLSCLLTSMACSLFGISNDIAMQVVGVGHNF